MSTWENVVIERGDSRLGLPWNSPQAGSLTASTESRTNYVAAMDLKDKLLDIAAQMLGGAAADYDLGNERVVSQGRSVEVDQLCAGGAEGDRTRRQVQRQGGAGGHQSGHQGWRGDDRRHRPDRRCQGQPAARRRHARPDRVLRRDRARHRDRQVRDPRHAVRRGLRHGAASRKGWRTRSAAAM